MVKKVENGAAKRAELMRPAPGAVGLKSNNSVTARVFTTSSTKVFASLAFGPSSAAHPLSAEALR